MSYAIMRCTKLNTGGSLAAALQHCYRERDTPNADDARTPQNEHKEAGSVAEAKERMKQLLPEKRRKDAVLAVEYVFTASPEWFKEQGPQSQQVFFDRSVDWLAEKYGRDRIVTATIHRDETTPHLSAFVVPLTQDGRLCASDFIGSREKLRNDQTSYAAAVADLGLERGLEGSRAKHQTIREHYAQVNKGRTDRVTVDATMIQPQKTGLFSKETPEEVALRVNASLNKELAPVYAKAATSRPEGHRYNETVKSNHLLSDALKRAENRAQRAESALRARDTGLNPQQVEIIRKLENSMRKENREKQRTRGKDSDLGH